MTHCVKWPNLSNDLLCQIREKWLDPVEYKKGLQTKYKQPIKKKISSTSGAKASLPTTIFPSGRRQATAGKKHEGREGSAVNTPARMEQEPISMITDI